jgi:UDP-glucose 4-epimerase
MRKNILITGGLGYIGSSLAKYLLSTGEYNVYLTSRNKRVLPIELNGCNLVEVNFESPKESFSHLFKEIDLVIHLAALNEIDSLKYPEKAIEINVLGTYKILASAIENKVTKFIYFSTAHVYGSPLSGNLNETIYPIPIHPYAITHKAAEDYIIAANQEKKIQGIVIRLSNAVGAPIHSEVDRWTLLVNDLCRQIVEQKKITLRSSGVQVRNFITMRDVCRATQHLLNLNNYDSEFPVYNLGGPLTTSVNNITEILSKICEIKYGFIPDITRSAIKETTVNLHFDNSKLQKSGFIWNNNLNLEIEETLAKAFKFFHNQL